VEEIAVKLTRPQLFLIVEQMEKGASAWETTKFCLMADRISKKLRLAAELSNGNPRRSNK
jgi:hypothetical protein